MFSQIIGTRIQDETGSKFVVVNVKEFQDTYVVLVDTLGNETLVNLNRYDQLISLPINNQKSWEECARVPYTITAGIYNKF